MKIFSSKALALCLGVFVFSTAISYIVMAWEEPDGAPPENNVAAPVNVGNATQTKTGGLNILGMVGIGNSNPTQKLDVSGGRVKGDGLCIGTDCCDNWTECVALGGGIGCQAVDADCTKNSDCCTNKCEAGKCAPSGGTGCAINGSNCGQNSECCSNFCQNGQCKGGSACIPSMGNCANNADCCSGACLSGLCTPFYPCSGRILPAGSKKIFVTSNVYDGKRFEIDADKDCQKTADAVGLGGTYKALVWAARRDINQVFPSGNSYWNGKTSGADNTECTWTSIANNMADFFTIDKNKDYLANPILYSEQGVDMTGLDVWTNFQPNGSGGYTLLGLSGYYYDNLDFENYMCHFWVMSGWAQEATVWEGNVEKKDILWAYHDNSSYGTATGHGAWDLCLNSKRAFYCVEQ